VPSEELAPCHPILNLTFSRHAGQKYLRTEQGDSEPQQPNLWQVIGKYDLLRIDSHEELDTAVNPIKETDAAANASAQNLTPDSDPGSSTPAAAARNSTTQNPAARNLAANSGVLLVPFQDFDKNVWGVPDRKANYQRFLRRVLMDGTSHRPDQSETQLFTDFPFLFLAQFTISAPAHEQGTKYDGVLDLIETIKNRLTEKYEKYAKEYEEYAKEYEVYQKKRDKRLGSKVDGLPTDKLLESDQLFFFRSLGASDLAIVALPQTPRQLCGLIHFASEARKLLLCDALDKSDTRKPPGHAFALVEDTVAFRATLAKDNKGNLRCAIPKSKQFPEQWKEWKLAIQTDIMLDAGHEGELVKKLVAKNRATRRLSGLHTIRLTFKDLHSFVEKWTTKLSDQLFHIENLIDSTSSIEIQPPFTSTSFDPDQETKESEAPKPSETNRNPNSRAWQLKEAFTEELKDITGAIRAWAKSNGSSASPSLLRRTQYDDLDSLLTTFQTSFSRLETATALRDLLPFMRQLAACCKRPEWSEFLRDADTDRNRVREDIVKLISHLARAFQNRLEPRSQYPDPAIYRTLEHGASKIVPAYSTVYWLTSEIFAAPTTATQLSTESSTGCPATNCGVCLAIGSAGAVTFTEIFGDFRTHLLNNSDSFTLSEINKDPSLKWTAPLILLDASGHQLMQPELHTVNSFHEMLLFSDWLMLPKQKALRYELNKQLLRDIPALAADVMNTLSKTPIPNEVGEFLGLVTLTPLKDDGESKNDHNAFEQYCHETDPRSTMDDYADDSLGKWRLDDKTFNRIASNLNYQPEQFQFLHPFPQPKTRSAIPEGLSSYVTQAFVPQFSDQLRAHSLAFRELLADRIKFNLTRDICSPESAHQLGLKILEDSLSRWIGDRLKKSDSIPNDQHKDRATALWVSNLLKEDKDEHLYLKIRDILLKHPALTNKKFPAATDTLSSAEEGLLQAFAKTITAVLKDGFVSPHEIKASNTHSTETLKPESLEPESLKISATLARIDYIMKLWAKSCRLGGDKIFEDPEAIRLA
jgi:hypothetical protein